MKKLLAMMFLGWMCVAQPSWAVDERNRAQIHADLGAGYFAMGNLAVALDELDKAKKIDSDYAPTYNYLGLVYMELREFDKADENFRRSLSLDSSNSDTQNNYGWFLCQRNREDEAIRYFMNAVKNPLYTTPGKAYLNAGQCALKKGDDKEAEDFFLRAGRYPAAAPQSQYYLAEIQYRRARYTDAQYHLEQFTKAGGQTAGSLWLGARIAHRTGNRESEANYGLQLRKKFPDSREAIAFRNNLFDSVDAGDGRP